MFSSVVSCLNSTKEFHDCSRNFINYASFGNLGLFGSSVFLNVILEERENLFTLKMFSWSSLTSALLTANKQQNERIQTLSFLIGASLAFIPPFVFNAKILNNR